MRRIACLAVALCAFAGCHDEPLEPGKAAAERTTTIDERAGTYRGVGLGDTRRKLERRFGRARVNDDGTGRFEPIGEAFYDVALPPTVDYPRGHKRAALWRFRGAVVDSYDDRAFTLAITKRDAVTGRGVGVGNDLDAVRALHTRAPAAGSPTRERSGRSPSSARRASRPAGMSGSGGTRCAA